MPETCRFVTVLDKPCGRPATWMFASHRIGETSAVPEGLCALHHEIALLEASFGCGHTTFSSHPIPEGSQQ